MSCNDLILLSTDPDDIAILEGPGVQSVNGKVGKVVLDAGDFEYDDTKEYSAGSVGAELKELSQKEIDVDSALSDTSTNPVQNKVIKAALDKKVTEETGKGLSTNDYTTEEKDKLADIEDEANKTIVDSALSLTSENPVQNKVATQEINNKADVIISTASGSIAHFEDGAKADAVSVIAHIEPVQDLNGYDYPWPGGGNKNKANIDDIQIGKAWNTGNNLERASLFIPVSPSTEYTVSITGFDNLGITYVEKENAAATTSLCLTTFTSGLFTRTTSASTGCIVIQFSKTGGITASDLANVKIQLESGNTATSWTPYSNICPITGHTSATVTRTGKNLIPNNAQTSTRNGVTFTVNNDGTITANGTASETAILPVFDFRNDNSLLDGEYVFSGCPEGGSSSTYRIDITRSPGSVLQEHGNGNRVVIGGDYSLTWLRLVVLSGTTVNNLTFKPMLRLASDTDDTYEPYDGETYPITFPVEAGTVYGGYVDAVNGKLVVDRAITTIGALTWTMYTVTEGALFRSQTIKNDIKPVASTSEVINAICSAYKATSQSNRAAYTMTTGIGSGSGNIDIIDSSYTSASEFKTAMADQTICYELATPIEYYFTPTQIDILLGTNNVWNDCNGNTDVEYKADTKLYIEQLTKPTEDDMVANTAIQSGKFFMVGNRLFLSTSAIASGDTINPGTNCTELSLADALNNLN